MRQAIIAYIPVIHRGYLEFFEKYPEHDILVIDPEGFPKLKYPYQRDIRSLPAQVIVAMLRAKPFARNAGTLNAFMVQNVLKVYDRFVFPDEDISRLVATYFPKKRVTYESVFLRWDMSSVKKGSVVADGIPVVTGKKLEQLMGIALKASAQSSDWWRQVGCLAITKDGKKFISFNRHLPNEQSPYIDGDPRSDFNHGEFIELTSAFHGEARLVAYAASKKGIALAGAKLFVTVFPCPGCAMSIAGAGFSEVYFKDGYSLINAKRDLDEAGVKLFRVQM